MTVPGERADDDHHSASLTRRRATLSLGARVLAGMRWRATFIAISVVGGSVGSRSRESSSVTWNFLRQGSRHLHVAPKLEWLLHPNGGTPYWIGTRGEARGRFR